MLQAESALKQYHGPAELILRPVKYPLMRGGMLRWARKYSQEAIPRWFRAVDIPETKPGIYKYKPNKKPQRFEAFSLNDSMKLEEAFKSQRKSEIVEEHGLFTVIFKDKLVKPTFWDGPAFSVRRSLWVEVSNGKVLPIEPHLDEQIEHCYQTKRSQKIEMKWPTKDGAIDVQGEFYSKIETAKPAIDPTRSEPFSPALSSSAPTIPASAAPDIGKVPLQKIVQHKEKQQPMLILNERKSWLSAFTKRYLYRGIPQLDSDGERALKLRPENKKRHIKHLVFCVHGIGQLLSIKFDQINFIKDVDGLRTSMATTYNKLDAEMKQKYGTGEEGNDSGIQVLPVMWRHRLDDAINGLRPHQLFGTTNLAADAVLDFVLYTDPAQRKLIQTVAAEEMNRMYKEFCDLHPEFKENPRVSIIGHSLGSVVAYDLVRPENALANLEFKIENLFTLGSPIGVLNLIQQAPPITRGSARSLYNIMRLADPVAARLEPLVARDSLKISPKPLPGGGTNVLNQVKELTGDLASQGEIITNKVSSILQFFLSKENEAVTKKPQPQSSQSASNADQDTKKPTNVDVDLRALKYFNRHGRLDFSVQESIDLSFFLGLAGHLMYLDNPDVVQFILKEILQVEERPKKKAD